MPEYLHPGVYIEETSFRGKSIEGVSTSTAGLVGRTSKGPEGKPTLVTSFADFQRKFGAPYAVTAGVAPKMGDYLGHAVRAFFENGGLRAYIVRTLHSDAQKAFKTLPFGQVYTLKPTKALRVGMTVIPLASTRGIKVNDHLRIFTRPDASSAFVDRGESTAITAVDVVRNEITITTALTAAQIGGTGAPATVSSNSDNTCFFPTTGGTFTAVQPAGNGPTFRALYRGGDGNNISIQVRSADRPAVAIRTAAGAATDTLDVASTAGFYQGGIVEVVRGTNRDYLTIDSVDATNRKIKLSANTGGSVAVTDFVRTLEVDILIFENGALAETFAGLSWNPNPALDSFSRYYAAQINDSATGSDLVEVMTTTSTPPPVLAAPQPPNLALDPTGQLATPFGVPFALTGGGDGSDLTANDLIGTDLGPGKRTGIEALKERDDIALVAVPGVTDIAVQGALLVHCERLKYRFAILDGAPSESDISKIEQHRNSFDSKYGGFYTPWLKTLDLSTGREMIAPPSGYVLGICARVDNERGVHKAPANEVVSGITGIELPFGNGEQDVLNPEGINLIREFEGRGIRVWGGRTTTSDTEWKYVNVRRLFIYLEHSIDRGTQWVVFEPNNEALWQRVVETIDSFLFGVWKSGALMGTKPEEAYFVRCDRTTMTQDDIDNGRLVCLIGVAPAYPAEFVVFRIGQFTASSNAS
jgi:phage tail sheath protein FI